MAEIQTNREGRRVLYVGCGNCRATIPLVCTGQFMPHIPLPIAASQAGVSCGFCGLLAPVFTCGYCWTSQALYVPGNLTGEGETQMSLATRRGSPLRSARNEISGVKTMRPNIGAASTIEICQGVNPRQSSHTGR